MSATQVKNYFAMYRVLELKGVTTSNQQQERATEKERNKKARKKNRAQKITFAFGCS